MHNATPSTCQEKLHQVEQRLAAAYGTPVWQPGLDPVAELVNTILSQATSDLNRDKGFAALKARFASWVEVMDADPQAVIDTIRPAGLANQKGPRIQAALRTIWARRGTMNLDFLAELPLDEAKAWLTSIEGVGPKTAAIVLLFAFNRPTFPVDTHVHRISQRVGLIKTNVTADKAHDLLENAGDPITFYPLHLNLIRHGREVCQARQPRCEVCVLQTICDFYHKAGEHTDEEHG
jgi:endonuclease-3